MASPFNCRIIEPSLIHILVLYLLCTYTIYLLTDNCCITLYVRLTPFDYNAFLQNKVIHFWEEVKITAFFFFFLSFFFVKSIFKIYAIFFFWQNQYVFALLTKRIGHIFSGIILKIYFYFLWGLPSLPLSPLSFFLSIFLFSSFTPSLLFYFPICPPPLSLSLSPPLPFSPFLFLLSLF